MMFKLKILVLALLLSASSLAVAGPSGWNYYWYTPSAISPADDGSYPVGTILTYKFTIMVNSFYGCTCSNITATTSLTSSPWAATPVKTSVTWGVFGTAEVAATVTVGLGTSTIKINVATCTAPMGTGAYDFKVTGIPPPNNVKISGLPSTYSGNFQTLGGTTNSTISTPGHTACVYTSKSNGNYYVRISGIKDSGGSYYMAKGTDKFPVTIEWNGTQLTPGTNKLFTTGNTTSQTCGGSTNATMVIKASSADVLKVPGSATQYTDSFSVTVTHPDEI